MLGTFQPRYIVLPFSHGCRGSVFVKQPCWMADANCVNLHKQVNLVLQKECVGLILLQRACATYCRCGGTIQAGTGRQQKADDDCPLLHSISSAYAEPFNDALCISKRDGSIKIEECFQQVGRMRFGGPQGSLAARYILQ